MTFSTELAKAYAQAQGAMPKLIKDSTNPHFNNQYASLAAVLDAVRKPLADHGLALYQSATTTVDEGGKPMVVVQSMLIHESGQYIESELPMPIAQNTPQGIGSAITYGRRYAAMAICGIAPDDDDDGAGASGTTETPRKAPQAQRNGAPTQHRNGATNGKPTPQPQAPTDPVDDTERARKAFHAAGTTLFGKEWDTARPQVVQQYTAKKTPDNVRKSSNTLNAAELDEIAGTFTANANYWRNWLQEHMAVKA